LKIAAYLRRDFLPMRLDSNFQLPCNEFEFTNHVAQKRLIGHIFRFGLAERVDDQEENGVGSRIRPSPGECAHMVTMSINIFSKAHDLPPSPLRPSRILRQSRGRQLNPASLSLGAVPIPGAGLP
jgi:hypothetical protein